MESVLDFVSILISLVGFVVAYLAYAYSKSTRIEASQIRVLEKTLEASLSVKKAIKLEKSPKLVERLKEIEKEIDKTQEILSNPSLGKESGATEVFYTTYVTVSRYLVELQDYQSTSR
ncbi:hypothetical protein [Vibrio harveyi]|uniref:hypothetical protein n=1 Tax=Vibrio harveyi TaxID=669 RepID=UPI002380B8D8|nr:hypothetical protein [Vibrio harveyi]